MAYKPTLWHRFTNFLIGDLYTLEERELIFEKARELRLKNDKIEEQRKREKEADETFRTVAYAKFNCELNGKGCFFNVELQKNKEYRRVEIGSLYEKENGRYLPSDKKSLETFMKGTDTYHKFINPWHRSVIDTKDLKGSKIIIVLKKEIESKENAKEECA